MNPTLHPPKVNRGRIQEPSHADWTPSRATIEPGRTKLEQNASHRPLVSFEGRTGLCLLRDFQYYGGDQIAMGP